MNDDFEIVLSETPKYKDKDLSVKVYKNILDDIMKYAKGDLDHERGGFLLGNLEETENVYSIFITDMLIAKHTVNNMASLTFTHDSWNEAYREMDENHKEKIMLGWFHSHPGYGIFLSGMDMFIENNFFSLPYQVAYVVDPCADTYGFFGWEKPGKIQKVNNIVFQ